MTIPVEIAAVIGMAILASAGSVIAYLVSRIREVEENVKSCSSNLNSLVERRHVESRDYLKELVAAMTPKIHCDSKQDLWQARFEAMQAQSKLEHDQLTTTIFQLTAEVRELSTCVENLARKKEC